MRRTSRGRRSCPRPFAQRQAASCACSPAVARCTVRPARARGTHLVGSRRKVMSSDLRKVFMPVKRPCGLRRSAPAARHRRHARPRRGLDTRLAVVDDDSVGEVGGHDQIVLDDEGRRLAVQDEPLDHAAGDDALLRVEVGARLVLERSVFAMSESAARSGRRARACRDRARWRRAAAHRPTASAPPRP